MSYCAECDGIFKPRDSQPFVCTGCGADTDTDTKRIVELEKENAHQERMLRAAFEREYEDHKEFATDERFDSWLRSVSLLAEIALEDSS